MSYVNPDHPLFHGWPSASGPGIHADEADSALPSIGDKLPPAVARDLEKQSEAAWGVRRNPKGDEELPIATQQAVSEAAMWITGMWGPEEKAEERRRAFLPTVRENPIATKIPFGQRPETFFDRMRICFDTLTSLRDSAKAAYDKRGAGKRRDWQTSIEDCVRAVEFVLSQEHNNERSILSSSAGVKIKSGSASGLLGIGKWGIIAVKGNDKLPFAAYSEFPLTTCIGAGGCRNYCYSFKALRYPAAFRRFFLNTLANYADREFAILKASGGEIVPPSKYEERVRLALAGSQEPGYRIWQGIVKSIVLDSTKNTRKKGPAFLRLFVDGDINYEDNIIEWMYVCHEMDREGQDIRDKGLHHIEVYGYSKCWQQFVNVDTFLRNDSQAKFHKNGGWPRNYTVNMSDASVYGKAVRTQMLDLPISRGYFQVVDTKKYIKELSEACSRFGGCTSPNLTKLIEKGTGTAGFPIDQRRVNTLIAINEIKSAADVAALFGGLKDDAFEIERAHVHDSEPSLRDKLRPIAMRYYINALINDESWGLSDMIRRELVADQGMDPVRMSAAAPDQDTFLEALVDKQIKSLERFVAKEKDTEEIDDQALRAADEMIAKMEQSKGKGIPAKLAKLRGDRRKLASVLRREYFGEKALADKAVALALHETYWALDLGGSCPLVCGNCSDNPENPAAGAHRCASRLGREHSTGLFWGKTIHIGLH